MNLDPKTVTAHLRWLLPAAWQTVRSRPIAFSAESPIHVLIAVCDHFEPRDVGVSPPRAEERVAYWVDNYPCNLGGFRDSDGRSPRHSFFYPIEDYDADLVEGISQLCRAGHGELEVHLHHDGDTAETLRRTLLEGVERFAGRHGALARHRATGKLGYAFIHGNWALNNARPDGCWCGVNDEIRVLRETGCYADFTYPSAPSPTQPPTLNAIYHAQSHAAHPRGHDRGVRAGLAPAPEDALLMVEGPLLLDARRRKWGVVPKLENACLQLSQPPSMRRLDLWLRAHVHVPSRPDWCFVKLHAHGATERDRDTLLGPPMQAFHEALAQKAAETPGFCYHYVSAREMANLALAAASGFQGAVENGRDFVYVRSEGEPAALGASAARGEPLEREALE
ncbi:MAG: hypothetical protein U0794_01350 [Isosphaeraceae bacterium]